MELGPEKLDVYCHSIGYVAWVYEKTRNSAACCEVLQKIGDPLKPQSDRYYDNHYKMQV